MLQALAHVVGQTYYSYSPSTTAASPGGAFWAAYFGIIGVLLVAMLVSLWKVFTKAGQPGWAVLIPFYNTYILLKIVGRPGWWLLLFFLPFVNIIVAIIVYYDLVKAFGQGVGFLLLILLLPIIGFPMLAFGKYQYHAPAAPVPQQ